MNVHQGSDRLLHERSLKLAATAVDFDLTRAETSELDAHLATCSTCARRAAAIRADASRLSAPLRLLPSPRVDAVVYAAIARQHPRPQRFLLVAAAAALLLVALLGAMVVGGYLLRNLQTLPITVVPTPTRVASSRKMPSASFTDASRYSRLPVAR